jgi:hypothetical protein
MRIEFEYDAGLRPGGDETGKDCAYESAGSGISAIRLMPPAAGSSLT